MASDGSTAMAAPSEPIATRPIISTPAGDIGLTGPALDLIGGKVHRLHPAGAEAVDGKAGDRFIEVRGKDGRPRKAATLFADLRDVAPDHILDRVARQAIAFLDRVQDARRQRDRRDLVQRAVGAALATGAAHGVVDEGLGHVFSSRQARSEGFPGIRS